MQRRIVIAPDSFKGTATAKAVAQSIRTGWLSVRPEDTVDLLPMADGGEGTIDAFAAADPAARRVTHTVHGPLGTPTGATLLAMSDGGWIIELAETSGIALLDSVSRETAAQAHTFGLGEAIKFAIDQGARQVSIALGSSASTDGGVGALRALGVEFLDASGAAIPLGNAGLEQLAHVDFSRVTAMPPEGIVLLNDVTNPLLGPDGSAAVFAPQKGANPRDVRKFDDRLSRLVSVLDSSDLSYAQKSAAPKSAAQFAEIHGTGAAGGTAFGLVLLGAHIRPGAVAIADTIGLPEQIATADAVITGEGSFDEQSFAGKVPSQVLKLAETASVDAYIIAGRIDDAVLENGAFHYGQDLVSLTEIAGSSAAAIAEPTRWLKAAGAELARRFNRSSTNA